MGGLEDGLPEGDGDLDTAVGDTGVKGLKARDVGINESALRSRITSSAD